MKRGYSIVGGKKGCGSRFVRTGEILFGHFEQHTKADGQESHILV